MALLLSEADALLRSMPCAKFPGESANVVMCKELTPVAQCIYDVASAAPISAASAREGWQEGCGTQVRAHCRCGKSASSQGILLLLLPWEAPSGQFYAALPIEPVGWFPKDLLGAQCLKSCGMAEYDFDGRKRGARCLAVMRGTWLAKLAHPTTSPHPASEWSFGCVLQGQPKLLPSHCARCGDRVRFCMPRSHSRSIDSELLAASPHSSFSYISGR